MGVTTPVPDSYWVEPGRLLVGEYPGSVDSGHAKARLAAFRSACITSFVDLTEEGELEPYAKLLWPGARWQRLPIRDLGCPTRNEMTAILARVGGELARGEVVYLHCWGGHGRTGTAVGCWLAGQGLSPSHALTRIRWLRRNMPDAGHASPETAEQIRFVLDWAV